MFVSWKNPHCGSELEFNLIEPYIPVRNYLGTCGVLNGKKKRLFAITPCARRFFSKCLLKSCNGNLFDV